MGRKLEMIVPGLFDLPPGEVDREFVVAQLPHVNRLLGRAGSVPNECFTIDAMVLDLFGQNLQQSLPLAESMRQEADPTGDCVLFQPIHLHADFQNAIILPIQNDDNYGKDISLIINDLGELFKEDFYIRSLSNQTFIMIFKDIVVPTHFPHFISVLGKSSNPYLEQSRQKLAWYKLLNEIQMYLHQHPANQQRTSRGATAINSFWFYGAGALDQPIGTELTWFCDDELLRQFGDHMSFNCNPLQGFAMNDSVSDAVLIDLRLITALKTNQNQDLKSLLLELDRDVFAPAFDGYTNIRLRAGFGQDFLWSRQSHLKFWVKPRNLSDWSIPAV
ncbi:MAG: hypothetical protein AAF353_09270 [Pseudomonadota bacterium]